MDLDFPKNGGETEEGVTLSSNIKHDDFMNMLFYRSSQIAGNIVEYSSCHVDS